MHLVHLNDAPSLLTEGPLNKWQVTPPQQLWIMQFNLKNWASLLSSAQLSAVLDFVWLWLQNQVHCYPEVSLGEDSGKNMCRVPIHRMKDRNFQMGHNFRFTEVSFPRDENEMQLNTGWVFVRALPFIPCNVQVLFIIRVSIEDLKKPLNTKFSIRPKRVSIMVAGCQ